MATNSEMDTWAKEWQVIDQAAREDVAGRANFKWAVLTAFENAAEDPCGSWFEDLQTAADFYYLKLSTVLPLMKKSNRGRTEHMNKQFRINNLEKTMRIQINNDSDIIWSDVLSHLYQLSESSDTTPKQCFLLYRPSSLTYLTVYKVVFLLCTMTMTTSKT